MRHVARSSSEARRVEQLCARYETVEELLHAFNVQSSSAARMLSGETFGPEEGTEAAAPVAAPAPPPPSPYMFDDVGGLAAEPLRTKSAPSSDGADAVAVVPVRRQKSGG